MLQTDQPLFRDQEDRLNTVPDGLGKCRGDRGSGKEQDGSNVRVHCVTGVGSCKLTENGLVRRSNVERRRFGCTCVSTGGWETNVFTELTSAVASIQKRW